MRPRSEAILWGCLKLVTVDSSIGIPVFSAYGSNRQWIPETDGDFKITRFLELPPDHGFSVSDDIPPVMRRRFGIGDYCPMPYWLDGELMSVSGDSYPDQVMGYSHLSVGACAVVSDVRQLLNDARNGRFKFKLEEDEADRIEAAFPDVFKEAPVHSKYWISRYRLAATQARAETKPPHKIDDQLLSVGREWLARFGTKTDYPRLRALLGKPSDGIYSREEISNIAFAYIVDRIERGSIAEIVKWVLQDREFISIFPGGIYRHLIEGGWPNAPFPYRHPKEILGPLMTAVRDNSNDIGMLSALRSLTFVYFGNEESPAEFNNFLFLYRTMYFEMLREATNTIRRLARGFESKRKYEYEDACVSLVTSFDALRYLDGMEYPDGRRKDLRKPIRNISADYIDSLRPHVEDAKAAAAHQRALERWQAEVYERRMRKYEQDTDDLSP